MKQEQNRQKFGWSITERKEEIKKLLASRPEATTRIVFKGRNADLPILRVPINLPKYRLTNGRTVSLQSEYLAKNPSIDKDLFKKDYELWESQETQHKLLLQLAKTDGTDLKKEFENPDKKQTDPLILDENGFVVNGNRRLAVWRDLFYTDAGKYSHFSHVDISVLPHCEEKEIDRLEARLQIIRDLKADYSWDSRANMFLEKMNRDKFSIGELADLYEMKESEIQKLIDMRAYAAEYLESRNKKNFWSLVCGDEYAFGQIVDCRKKIDSPGKQEFFVQAAFALIDKSEDAGGRLYESIPAILEYLPQIQDQLTKEFKPSLPQKDKKSAEIFGAKSTHRDSHQDLILSKEIQKKENIERTRTILVEVIRVQKELKKDAKSARYLIDSCARAQSILASAVKDGLRPECRLSGIENQLDQILDHLNKIRKFLNKK